MNPWPAALQNLTALVCTTYLAKIELISGQMAGGMILAILGVIAIPAFKAPKTGTGSASIPPSTGTLGIFAVMCSPVVRAAAAAMAAGTGKM